MKLQQKKRPVLPTLSVNKRCENPFSPKSRACLPNSIHKSKKMDKENNQKVSNTPLVRNSGLDEFLRVEEICKRDTSPIDSLSECRPRQLFKPRTSHNIPKKVSHSKV